jgi:ATP-dependent protease ClpP protease subunit
MYIRGWAALLLLITFSPTIVSAQYTERQCASVLDQTTDAYKMESFKQIISSSRWLLTYCKNVVDYASVLGGLAHGLNGDGQFTEALGVTNQCLKVSVADFYCIDEKARALISFKRLSEAKRIIERSLTLGAITEDDVVVKRDLQDLLIQVNVIANRETSTSTKGENFKSQDRAASVHVDNVSGGLVCMWPSANGVCTGEQYSFSLSISGLIDSSTVEKAKKLFDERRRRFKEISAERFEINSLGGSVPAAMEIGRMFRNEGAYLILDDGHVCISACVLILAGAVDRLISEKAKVGIHRPYLSTTPEQPITADQVRNSYQAMLKDMRAYLHEMNVAERLADDMLATEPERVHILTQTELGTYGLAGVDPAEQRKRAIDNEVRDVQEANELGLDRREYTRRKAVGEAQCAYTAAGQAVTDYAEFLRCKQKILTTGQR